MNWNELTWTLSSVDHSCSHDRTASAILRPKGECCAHRCNIQMNYVTLCIMWKACSALPGWAWTLEPPPGKPPFHTFNCDVTRDIKAGHRLLFSLFFFDSSSLLPTDFSTTPQQGAPCCAALQQEKLEAWSLASLPKVWPAKQSPFSQQRFKNLLKTKIQGLPESTSDPGPVLQPSNKEPPTDLLSHTGAGNS